MDDENLSLRERVERMWRANVGKNNDILLLNAEIGDLRQEVEQLKRDKKNIRDIVIALLICGDDDADGRDCPMYREDAEWHCALDAALKSIGIEVE